MQSHSSNYENSRHALEFEAETRPDFVPVLCTDLGCCVYVLRTCWCQPPLCGADIKSVPCDAASEPARSMYQDGAQNQYDLGYGEAGGTRPGAPAVDTSTFMAQMQAEMERFYDARRALTSELAACSDEIRGLRADLNQQKADMAKLRENLNVQV